MQVGGPGWSLVSLPLLFCGPVLWSWILRSKVVAGPLASHASLKAGFSVSSRPFLRLIDQNSASKSHLDQAARNPVKLGRWEEGHRGGSGNPFLL